MPKSSFSLYKKPEFYLMICSTHSALCSQADELWAPKKCSNLHTCFAWRKKQSKHNYLYYTSACCAYILTCMSFLCVVLYVCVVEKYHPKALYATNVFHLSYSFSLQLRFLEQVIQSVKKTCQNTHQNMPVLLSRLACWYLKVTLICQWLIAEHSFCSC